MNGTPTPDLTRLIEHCTLAVGAVSGALYSLEAEAKTQVLLPVCAWGPDTNVLFNTSIGLLVPPERLVAGAGPVVIEPDAAFIESPTDELLGVLRKGRAIVTAVGEGKELRVFAVFGSQSGEPISEKRVTAAAQLLTGAASGHAVKELKARQESEVEFLAGLGHELKTPLNAIIGFASLLERQIRDEELLEEVEMITMSSQKLLALIDDLIDSYKIQAGKLILHREQYNINEILANSVETIRVIADERNIRVRTFLDSAVPDFPIDVKRLQQVMVNLLGNAVKFVPGGGEIIVRSNAESDCARVQVADTGEGIPPEVLPYVFERYRQAQGSEARDVRSAGLGLALCRDFVEMHGGEITVTSERKKGSCFEFTLPFEFEGPPEPVL